MALRSLNPLAWSRRTQLVAAVGVGAAAACAVAAVTLYRRRHQSTLAAGRSGVEFTSPENRVIGAISRVSRLSGDVPEHLKAAQAECVTLIEARAQLEKEGNWSGVEATVRKLQEVISRAVGDTDADYMRGHWDIAHAQIMQGKFEEAYKLRNSTLTRALELYGEDDENKLSRLSVLDLVWFLEPKLATDQAAAILGDIAQSHGPDSLLAIKAIVYFAEMGAANGDAERAARGFAAVIETADGINPATDESRTLYIEGLISLCRALRLRDADRSTQKNYRHLMKFVEGGAVDEATAYRITADVCSYNWDSGNEADARAQQATLLSQPLYGALGFSRYLSTVFLNVRPATPQEEAEPIPVRGVIAMGLMINFTLKHLAQVEAGATIDYVLYPTLFDATGAIVQIKDGGELHDLAFEELPMPPQQRRLYGFSLRLRQGTRFPRGKYLLELAVHDNTAADKPRLGVHRQIIQSYFDIA